MGWSSFVVLINRQTQRILSPFSRIYGKNTKSKGISLFSRKKQEKKEVVNSENESSGLDISQIENLLQNPTIQSFLKRL
jgi:hypothetical protein